MDRHMTRLAIEGQGLVEYALIILLIALAVVGALTGAGTALGNSLTNSAGIFP